MGITVVHFFNYLFRVTCVPHPYRRILMFSLLLFPYFDDFIQQGRIFFFLRGPNILVVQSYFCRTDSTGESSGAGKEALQF